MVILGGFKILSPFMILMAKGSMKLPRKELKKESLLMIKTINVRVDSLKKLSFFVITPFLFCYLRNLIYLNTLEGSSKKI